MHHTAFRAPPGRRVADDEPIRCSSGNSNPGLSPAFIHAKASRKESFCSASALHDVASQAIKNLPHLRPMTVLPLNRSRWGRRWSSGHVTGTTHRLRYGQFGSSDHMWRHISGHVTAPDVEREGSLTRVGETKRCPSSAWTSTTHPSGNDRSPARRRHRPRGGAGASPRGHAIPRAGCGVAEQAPGNGDHQLAMASYSRATSAGDTCCGQDWRRLRSGEAMPCSSAHSAWWVAK